MKRTRKGFTLIELLVVISVLGAIAAMMSISSGEAMTSAKAGNIINNLRNFVTAANEYYFDNMDKFYDATESATAPDIIEVRYYMNKGVSDTSKIPENKLENYLILTAEKAEGKTYAEVDWYVGYQFPTSGAGSEETLAIKTKLEGRATNIGLYGTAANPTAVDDIAFTKDHAVVWMKAREKSRRTN